MRLAEFNKFNNTKARMLDSIYHMTFTLNAPIATKIVCFSRLLKCLRSLYGKQCGPRSDCSYRLYPLIVPTRSNMTGKLLTGPLSNSNSNKSIFLFSYHCIFFNPNHAYFLHFCPENVCILHLLHILKCT